MGSRRVLPRASVSSYSAPHASWVADIVWHTVYSADAPVGLSLLAAHLYYRALHLVPSLIRSWLSDCRDRQLSLAVTTFTSTYFSPAIVRAEFAQVRDPVQAAELSDENFSVKVAGAVNEVTAAFAVDEQALEMRLKLPADFPLHTVIVMDTGRVGVTEQRWRSWILGIQQILTYKVREGFYLRRRVCTH